MTCDGDRHRFAAGFSVTGVNATRSCVCRHIALTAVIVDGDVIVTGTVTGLAAQQFPVGQGEFSIAAR